MLSSVPRILLVVDDGEHGQDLLARLDGFGCARLELATSRQQAVNMAGGQSFDLTLVVIGAGGEAEGLETAARLRECSGVPVVFVGNRVDRERLDMTGRAGIRGWIVPSADDRALLAALDMALRGQGPGDARILRRSLDHLQRTLEQTVNALAVTSEKRDPFTAGHQQRVSELSKAIAGELCLSEDDQEGVRMAGLVHDIGKIHVPSEILAKTEKLSDLEMRIVQGHSEVGYEILKDVPFPWPVARMVLEHHERLDGSGYPAGLHGHACLRESRILAVADVVEAMTSHRPYRAAHGLEQALAEVRANRGTLYEPDVVDACLELCEKGKCF
jgi:putative nucleotidyltransferase with HDIG domain